MTAGQMWDALQDNIKEHHMDTQYNWFGIPAMAVSLAVNIVPPLKRVKLPVEVPVIGRRPFKFFGNILKAGAGAVLISDGFYESTQGVASAFAWNNATDSEVKHEEGVKAVEAGSKAAAEAALMTGIVVLPKLFKGAYWAKVALCDIALPAAAMAAPLALGNLVPTATEAVGLRGVRDRY